MLEGLVRQLLLGYLGRYIKDIQKEQLKITLWNEEVLLENVELILEAFDYLQLPFALKQGRLGRLSIKIPWKKLGWDPIIIVLEDVFVCVSQRDDQEWSLNAVERREFAGKKAKLAAAELAKLSRCVGDNHAGQSFISYITTKILDSIQVSIRNFHVLYRDWQTDSDHITLGLKFSSLTLMKHRSYCGWARGGQVNKIVEIIGLEVYCSTFQRTMGFLDNVGNSKLWHNEGSEGKGSDSLLAPCDISVSLLVNKSGKLDNDAPQYSVTAELTGLEISLNEVQLQQLLVLLDYLDICRLREMYGRYRPWGSPLSRKVKGWQIHWWHYAQESVLSDIRKRLKKTSWRYLGQRLSYRRKYVNLYKTKLEFLQQEQSIEEDIIWELEQMEKESDIDDILSYRSAAEHELQEFSSKSSMSKMGRTSSGVVLEKSGNDDNSAGRSRGWLNWLSRGMLGAGGTDDSSQFSGVVSGELIEDIYEATEFHPPVLSDDDGVANDKTYHCAIKFSICQISATLKSLKYRQGIAEFFLLGLMVECKLCEESATITAVVESGKMVCPYSKKVILLLERPIDEEVVLENEHPSCTVQVDVSPNREVELLVKGMLQPVEVTFDAEFFMKLFEFFDVLKFLSFQHERLLSSLNGIENVSTRLLAKAEYILSARKKVMWDVSITNIVLNVPWRNSISKQFNLVVEVGALLFISKSDLSSASLGFKEQPCHLKNLINSISSSDLSMCIHLEDLYDHFEIKLNDFEMEITVPDHNQPISVIEKFCPSITVASCVILDESISKQLEVYIIVSSLQAHFSPTIYGALRESIAHLSTLHSKSGSVTSETLVPPGIKSNKGRAPDFGFTISANLESVTLLVDLANDGDSSFGLMLAVRDTNMRYALTKFEEFWICVKALKVTTCPLRGQGECHVLCSCGNASSMNSVSQPDIDSGLNDKSDRYNDTSLSAEGCLLLHYESQEADSLCHKCTVCLNEADVHCYPYIIGLLGGFFDRLSVYGTSSDSAYNSAVDAEIRNKVPHFRFQRFGFSNFFETGSSEHASIPVDHFPFATICNAGPLASLESSPYPNSDWRKYLNLRDQKTGSPKFSRKVGSKSFHAPPLVSTSGIEVSHLCETSGFVIDFHLCQLRVHFHDATCIIGIITLPVSKSSLFINEDSMDLLCSTEGLILTSSWCTQNFREFLWGPSVPNLSPILNIRVKQGKSRSLDSHLEVSMSIQHVYCLLPAEYLAIMIGYFSLSDWRSNANDQPVTGGHENINTGNESPFVYKLEILESTLILPVESYERQFLKVEIPQLYCSFIDESISDNVLRETPLEYLVPVHKCGGRGNCLNVFGQDLCLLFLLVKDDGCGFLTSDQDTDCKCVTLVAPLSADVWVTIPSESELTERNSVSTSYVMTRIQNCQIMADDGYFLPGIEALLDVIEQFSLVHDQSKGFKSDVLQFIQLKKSLKEIGAVLPVGSSLIFTEVRCTVDSLSIKLHCCGEDSPELLAKVGMQFSCSASLKNDALLSLGVTFSSLKLNYLPNSIILAQCTSTCSSSVLDISISRSVQEGIELFVSLPSLDIWLHLSEWTKVLVLINLYLGRLNKTTLLDPSAENLTSNIGDPLKNVAVDKSPRSPRSASMSTEFESVNMKQDHPVSLVVRSENVGITFYFPLWVSKEASRQLQLANDHVDVPQNASSEVLEEKDCKFVAVNLHSRSTGFFIDSGNIKFNSNLENLSGTVLICNNNSVPSWPLFQIYKVGLEADIRNKQMERMHITVDIQCDRVDVWLSHRLLYFLHGVHFNIPKAESSEFAYGEIVFKAQFKKVSLLLSDGRWNCGGPLLEILLRNIILHANVTENNIEGSVTVEFLVNYNNIHKALWEPFVEPWQFQMAVIRKNEMSALLNSFIMTDIQLKSTGQLNLNFTESLIECLSRTIEMIKDAWDLIEPYDHPEGRRFLNSAFTKYTSDGKYAPYMLQNLTSVPLIYRVYQGLVNSDEFDASGVRDGNHVEPGCSVPIYINETPEEQLFRFRPTQSSDRLNEQKSNGVAHHFITIQLEGTSVTSAPISMDLVGLTYFEVDFSKPYNEDTDESGAYTCSGFVVPVVFDVSVQRYCKLICLYSTVVLSNASSIPLELRFDIPFGISPEDPIYPGHELPLPLHLAEAGRVSWRPIGNSYLWSEYYSLSSLLSQESRIGFLKSFACYPLHASGDPFRCCVSVRDISLQLSGRPKKGGEILHNEDDSKKRFVHQVMLSTPLVVNNYLPEAVSLTIESSGVTRTAVLSVVETSFHHIDPSHDLSLEINMRGFKPLDLKFARMEKFCTRAKFNGNKFSVSESLTFYPELSNGPVYVTVEKTIDAFSGARELFIFVPFLLYNCTGFPLLISESADDKKGGCIIPSCYDLAEQELLLGKKDGLSLLLSNHDSHAMIPRSLRSSSVENRIISTRENVNLHSARFLNKPLISSNSRSNLHEILDKIDLDTQKAFLNSSKDALSSSSPLTSSNANSVGHEHGRVRAFMYSPISISSTNEVMVRVSRYLPECVSEKRTNSSWSSPFFLVPPSGSSTVIVPKSSSNAAYVVSVTSSAVAGPFAGRTNAITVQPRYVISNACHKDLCYKQKGTDFVFRLGVGEHAHLHWTDAAREFLVSIRYDEPGWQWSGGFLPDHLGDTQVKLRNYVSNALNMIRVEVQNADVSIEDEKIVGSLHGSSGTNLILLSDDDTGYMPYRVDNFSKETLRIYQQKCETFETIVHSYTSCPYAWDEPNYPHRLTVEARGERVLGSYALDDVKEYMPVCLPSTSEKPERMLHLSVHAEGATKVLCVIDSSYHILNDVKNSGVHHFREGSKHSQEQEKLVDYKEKISIVIPHVGISLINRYPQELLFACATTLTIDMQQSLNQQKLFFQISSLQIDNQLRTTPFPVILSFDRESRCTSASQIRNKDKNANERLSQLSPDISCEPVFCLAVSKWRKKNISLVSFEYISLRVADFHLELEQEVILSLFDFFKNVYSRLQYSILPFSDPLLQPRTYESGLVKESLAHFQTFEYLNGSKDHLLSMNVPVEDNGGSLSLPSVVPIGAPWQQIYLLARRQQKIYVEVFDVAPIKLTLSFSSSPWMLRHGALTPGETLIHRGLMALADVEGARIQLKQLTIAHHMASWESIQEIIMRHYTRQLLHEMYKVFGSAGVIGNPIGFARSLGLGIRDFLSMPARSILQSPTGIITGMAQGSTSLLSNTVYAISDAATQFSKAAQKGIVAFTFDDQAVSTMEKQQMSAASQSKGVINEVLEGLTDLLQSPIKGAEKHGLPGVLSGIALGVTGLLAKPAASILEVTGKTAQSIRNRSRLYQSGPPHFRARLPRPLSNELLLRPYSWEEAVGTSVLVEADNDLNLKDEVLVVCKSLKQAGKFVIVTERFVLIVSCPSLVDLGKPEFQGIPADPEWVMESQIGLESIIHADTDGGVVHIVGSSPDTLLRTNQAHHKQGSGMNTVRWNNPPTIPLFQTNLELASEVDGENLFKILLSTIELGKERGRGHGHLLHRSDIKKAA